MFKRLLFNRVPQSYQYSALSQFDSGDPNDEEEDYEDDGNKIGPGSGIGGMGAAIRGKARNGIVSMDDSSSEGDDDVFAKDAPATLPVTVEMTADSTGLNPNGKPTSVSSLLDESDHEEEVNVSNVNGSAKEAASTAVEKETREAGDSPMTSRDRRTSSTASSK